MEYASFLEYLQLFGNKKPNVYFKELISFNEYLQLLEAALKNKEDVTAKRLPLLWDVKDVRYLYQFPHSCWNQALYYLYNDHVYDTWRVVTARELHQEGYSDSEIAEKMNMPRHKHATVEQIKHWISNKNAIPRGKLIPIEYAKTTEYYFVIVEGSRIYDKLTNPVDEEFFGDYQGDGSEKDIEEYLKRTKNGKRVGFYGLDLGVPTKDGKDKAWDFGGYKFLSKTNMIRYIQKWKDYSAFGYAVKPENLDLIYKYQVKKINVQGSDDNYNKVIPINFIEKLNDEENKLRHEIWNEYKNSPEFLALGLDPDIIEQNLNLGIVVDDDKRKTGERIWPYWTLQKTKQRGKLEEATTAKSKTGYIPFIWAGNKTQSSPVLSASDFAKYETVNDIKNSFDMIAGEWDIVDIINKLTKKGQKEKLISRRAELLGSTIKMSDEDIVLKGLLAQSQRRAKFEYKKELQDINELLELSNYLEQQGVDLTKVDRSRLKEYIPIVRKALYKIRTDSSDEEKFNNGYLLRLLERPSATIERILNSTVDEYKKGLILGTLHAKKLLEQEGIISVTQNNFEQALQLLSSKRQSFLDQKMKETVLDSKVYNVFHLNVAEYNPQHPLHKALQQREVCGATINYRGKDIKFERNAEVEGEFEEHKKFFFGTLKFGSAVLNGKKVLDREIPEINLPYDESETRRWGPVGQAIQNVARSLVRAGGKDSTIPLIDDHLRSLWTWTYMNIGNVVNQYIFKNYLKAYKEFKESGIDYVCPKYESRTPCECASCKLQSAYEKVCNEISRLAFNHLARELKIPKAIGSTGEYDPADNIKDTREKEIGSELDKTPEDKEAESLAGSVRDMEAKPEQLSEKDADHKINSLRLLDTSDNSYNDVISRYPNWLRTNIDKKLNNLSSYYTNPESEPCAALIQVLVNMATASNNVQFNTRRLKDHWQYVNNNKNWYTGFNSTTGLYDTEKTTKMFNPVEGRAFFDAFMAKYAGEHPVFNITKDIPAYINKILDTNKFDEDSIKQLQNTVTHLRKNRYIDFVDENKISTFVPESDFITKRLESKLEQAAGATEEELMSRRVKFGGSIPQKPVTQPAETKPEEKLSFADRMKLMRSKKPPEQSTGTEG